MPPSERLPNRNSPPRPGLVDPSDRSLGPAARMAEFSQPLVDAAGNDPEAIGRALDLGTVFWNLAVSAELTGGDFVLEQLPQIEKALCRSREDCRRFRDMTCLMLERYGRMRPGSRTDLVGIVHALWGKDLSAGFPAFGWLRRLTGVFADPRLPSLPSRLPVRSP